MTIQYPNKLNKKRRVYFTMDHASGKDATIRNTVITKLRNAGINVVSRPAGDEIGPNEYSLTFRELEQAKVSDCILIGLVNGVDPTNLREVGLDNYDWAGTRFRNLGNDVIFASFYDSCDFTRTDGTCYKRVQQRSPKTDVPYGTYFPYPGEYCKKNKIYAVNQSSNQHKNPERADYTGEKIADRIIELFDDGTGGTVDDTDTNDTNTNNSSNSNTEQDNENNITPENPDTSTKTIASRTITQTFTIAFYENVVRVMTDKNGAFKHLPTLPYKGEYTATIRYAGDKTHESTTKTVKIYNFSNKSSIFKEQLLQTKIITKYSDGTTKTDTNGTVPDNKHCKRIITTETYNKGKLSKTTKSTVYLDTFIQEKQVQDVNDYTPTNKTNPDDDPDEVYIDDKERRDPFQQVIPSVNGVPQINAMQRNGNKFVPVDTERRYTLTLDLFKEVYVRDSQMLQLHDYKLPKYTAFRCTEDNQYYVVRRGLWNFVVESIHAYLVRHNSYDENWPSTFILDFKNHRTKCGDTWIMWKGYKRVVEQVDGQDVERFVKGEGSESYGVQGEDCNFYIVGDRQDPYGGRYVTCGPTSLSVCSQRLMNYHPEFMLSRAAGTDSRGTGPDGIAKAARKYNMSATIMSGGSDSNVRQRAVAWLKTGKPWIWHIYNHYICLVYHSEYGEKTLVANSSGENSNDYNVRGRMNSGWNPDSNISSSFGQHVGIGLNWTMDATRSQSLQNFFQSMGGAWERPNVEEKLRRYRNGD